MMNFSWISFLPRAILKSNYTNIKKELMVSTLDEDGTTIFLPA